MKKTLLALGLAVITSSAFAYDGQVDGGFTYTDWDNDIVDSNGLFNLQGTLYLDSVNPKNGPLNEAAFLGHNSNIYAKYSYQYLDTKTVDVSDYFPVSGPLAGKAEYDSHHISLGAEYFFEQFYFNGELGYKEEKAEVKVAGISASEDYDSTTYRALVGYLPVSNLLLAVGIDGYQGDNDEDEDNRFAVKAKYVAPLNNGQYINLEADGAFGDLDSVTIGADYYFDQAFSIGASYNIEDDGDEDTDYFAIRSKYFLNPNLAIGGQVGFGDDVQAFNINATFRF
ncbi:porin [Acinetobacter sp. SH20PTE14]|uniref:porin n=1 Tax=Acinetobacter sp. SH20PTE14 TaxID=2905879 RepID=UPI001F1D2566|nr:putative porin [Acinetobacter sp. SH20PTE14]UIJ75603.1 putative porin [Acinetobacter sp. SH20PTE14]